MGLETLEDTTLVLAVADGDQSALAALYDRYAPLVYSIALRMLGDAPTAEEVVADAFLRLWRGARGYVPARGNVAAWLAAIVRHRALDERRRVATRPTLDTLDDSAHATEGVEVATRLDLAAALAALETQQRRLLELAYFEGLTHREIAERTGMPIGTVKSTIWRALESLRRSLCEDARHSARHALAEA